MHCNTLLLSPERLTAIRVTRQLNLHLQGLPGDLSGPFFFFLVVSCDVTSLHVT